MKTFLCALVVVLSQSALAHDGHDAQITMPKEFDTVKSLVGTWQGTANMGGKEEAVTVVYELTSGGTAIAERLMPGTPHEMVSMYYKTHNTLGMTHYCAMGNQPQLMLKSKTPNSLTLEMAGPVGVSSMKEPHMHALTLTMSDANSLKQEWTSYENGKAKETAVFNFTRKQ